MQGANHLKKIEHQLPEMKTKVPGLITIIILSTAWNRFYGSVSQKQENNQKEDIQKFILEGLPFFLRSP